MPFKIGDKVRINPKIADFPEGDEAGIWLNPSMRLFAGQVATIHHIIPYGDKPPRYIMAESGLDFWRWIEPWIIPLTPRKKINLKPKTEQKVSILT